MAEEEKEEQRKSMIETIMSVPGTKVLGPPGDKKAAAERILRSHEGRESFRNEKIMDDFADSVNHAPKSLGERLEGN